MTLRTWEMFEAEQNATDYGKAFIAAGFTLNMTGGGCTAWEQHFDNGSRLTVTDSEGVDCKLSDAHANDPSKPDAWLIGFYTSEDCDGIYHEVATHGEVVAASLALVFIGVMRGHYTNDTLEEIDRRNRSRNDDTCASHDFFDANIIMDEAFTRFFGRSTLSDSESISDDDCDLWRRAWNIAKRKGFSVNAPFHVSLVNNWIIIAGTVSGGLTFHGPFDTAEAAQDYAIGGGFGTYEISELVAPAKGDSSNQGDN
ncbi:hypothetical protein WKW50_16215 [Ochrobactrum sp. GPK 3]